jgi:transposase
MRACRFADYRQAQAQFGKEFTIECKDEAVKLVIITGRSVATVAREFGIQESTLGRH